MKALRLPPKVLAFLNPEFDVYARATYFALRSWIGGIGVMFPIVLVFGGVILGIHFSDMTALSDFYWLPIPKGPDALLRDWFVGSLIAVGICLIIYRGYGPLEYWLLNLAGAAIIFVALNPESWPPRYRERFHVHEAAAVMFFLMIAATIWCCADDTLEGVNQDVRKKWHRRYRRFAIAMVAAPAIALLVATERWRPIAVEVAGVWVFSAYWFVKTHELRRLSKLEPKVGAVPQLQRVGGRLTILNSSAPTLENSLRSSPAPAPPSSAPSHRDNRRYR